MSSILGLPIVLPNGADFAHALTRPAQFEAKAPGVVGWQHITNGYFYEFPLTINVIATTSAIVASRVITLVVLDQNGSELYGIPSPSVITASSTQACTFAVDIATVNPSGSDVVCVPLPPLPLFPLYTLRAFLNPGETGDTMTAPTMVSVLIPSAQISGVAGPAALTPTPAVT